MFMRGSQLYMQLTSRSTNQDANRKKGNSSCYPCLSAAGPCTALAPIHVVWQHRSGECGQRRHPFKWEAHWGRWRTTRSCGVCRWQTTRCGTAASVASLC